MPEFQPQNSYFQSRLQPDTISTITVSGGLNIPHSFYLGANSTVPFVQLESPVATKLITWGEVITIPPGSAVGIRSASYMPGDLQLSSGDTPVQRPPRITVPIEVSAVLNGAFTSLTVKPVAPCDTRTARRAWFCFDLQALALAEDSQTGDVFNIIATVRGYMQQHSSATLLSPLTTTPFEDSAVFATYGGDVSMIPLGVSLEGNAMRLADKSEIVLDIASRFVAWDPINSPTVARFMRGVCSYVVEY